MSHRYAGKSTHVSSKAGNPTPGLLPCLAWRFHYVVKTRVLAFRHHGVEACAPLSAAALLVVHDITKQYPAVPSSFAVRDFPVFQQPHQRRPRNIEQISCFLGSQHGVLRRDGDRQALGQSFDDVAERVVHLFGKLKRRSAGGHQFCPASPRMGSQDPSHLIQRQMFPRRKDGSFLKNPGHVDHLHIHGTSIRKKRKSPASMSHNFMDNRSQQNSRNRRTSRS